MKKTKIVGTIGPASESAEVLRELFKNGLNVCRLNFSHGTHEEHKKRIETIKAVREEMNMPIAIMLDTKGAEIRVKDFEKGSVLLKEGMRFTLTTRELLGNEKEVSITYSRLPEDVKVGDRILIDDGLIELQILEIERDTDIICEVVNGGEVKNHKGVNVPNVRVNMPAISANDQADIEFGIENGIDFIAASFVRRADDVHQIRRILEAHDAEDIEIIAKIENQEGVDNIDEIMRAADGIMVARGDLGVEIPAEEIPLVQKSLIKKANDAGKNVITATQMLDSMIRNPRPTRAEVTDVANAVMDGTGAIMLSGETAAGKYPVEAVQMMHNIAVRTEAALDYGAILQSKISSVELTTPNAIGKATCTTAYDLKAAAIITATSSGYTSRAISKFRPQSAIIAATTSERVMRRLSLVWGVYPVLAPYTDSTDDVIEQSIKASLDHHLVKAGDLVVLTAGIPVGIAGSTNLIKVHTIGHVMASGMGIGRKSVLGKVCVAETFEDLATQFRDGDIIVVRGLEKEMTRFVGRASGFIAEEGGLTSPAAIVAINLSVPTIIGVENAMEIFKTGDVVTLDCLTGQIYEGEARIF